MPISGEVSPCQMAHDLVLRECGGVCDHCPIRDLVAPATEGKLTEIQ